MNNEIGINKHSLFQYFMQGKYILSIYFCSVEIIDKELD
jgi:hypothetical protein